MGYNTHLQIFLLKNLEKTINDITAQRLVFNSLKDRKTEVQSDVSER